MNLDEMLKELQQKYIQTMPDKLASMTKHIETQNFQSLREEFHKIKGTGKTYGIPEISDLGAVFEEILIKCEFNPDPQWVKDALGIFKDIHTARVEQKAFEIFSDERFKNLQNALSQLKK